MSFRFLSSLLALWLLAAVAAVAKEPVRVTLPNGMKVVVVETYSAPTVSLNIFVRAGSLHETPDTTGLAHFYEHMFFRGTPTRSGLEFKKAIESLGGTTNATTSRDMTHYYINMPSQFSEQGLELMADALLHAEVSLDSVDKEREVVLQEYNLGLNNPGRIASDRLYELAFGEHPYGKSIIGEKALLEGYTRENLTWWKQTYYVPERTALVVVGDVDAQKVVAKARELFSNFKAQSPSRPDNFAPPRPPLEPQVVTETGPVSRTYVLLGYLAPSVAEKPDIYAVDVLSFLIGVGEQSLLSKSLVETGVAAAARVDFLTQAEPGLFIVSAAGDVKNVDQMRQAMLDVIERVQRGDFTDRELERARNLLVNSYRFGNESNSGKADSLGFYVTLDTLDFALGYVEAVKSVTREQVVEMARKYLGQSHYGLVMKPAGRGGRG